MNGKIAHALENKIKRDILPGAYLKVTRVTSHDSTLTGDVRRHFCKGKVRLSVSRKRVSFESRSVLVCVN